MFAAWKREGLAHMGGLLLLLGGSTMEGAVVNLGRRRLDLRIRVKLRFYRV